MRNALVAVFVWAIALWAAQPALAQQQTSQPFAFEQLPTHVVGITPAQGWRTAFFSVQGALGELGEVTPDADVANWRNLIAYITVAISTGQIVDDMNANLAEVAGHCRASAPFHVRPAVAADGEAWGQIVCLDRGGEANAVAAAPLQIYLFRSSRTSDATFRFWRAWRGTPAELGAMLQQAGIADAPRLPREPSSADLQRLEPVMARLTEVWARELTQTLEICDLAGQPCASLNRSVADVSFYAPFTALVPQDRLAAVVAVRGDRSNMAAATDMYRRVFQREPPSGANGIGVVTSLTPGNHNFRTGEGLAAVAVHLYIANKGIGGLVGISEAPPGDIARYRAYMLRVARFACAVRDGPAYDAYTFDLWPNQ